MLTLIANHCEFNDMDSFIDFGLYMCSFDQSEDDEIAFSKDIDTNEMSYTKSRTNIYSLKHSDPLVFRICFSYEDGRSFSPDNIGDINRWLLCATTAKTLSAYYGVTSQDCVEYDGVFTGLVYKRLGGKIIGLIYTFSCNAPYGYLPVLNTRRQIAGTKTFTCYNLSDDPSGYVYPVITISATSSSTVVLCNESDNDSTIEMYINMNTNAGEFASRKTIKIDCENHIITEQCYNADDEVIETNMLSPTYFGWNAHSNASVYWPRIAPGDNTLSVSGYCTITVSCRFPTFAPIIL